MCFVLQITISDEQYQTLEQKGWILLESNDKIYILNTLGLHDITSNNSRFINYLFTSIRTPWALSIKKSFL